MLQCLERSTRPIHERTCRLHGVLTEPESGGVGKKIQDAIDAGLDDYVTIQQVWNKLGEAVVNGHFLDGKDPMVKKIKKSWANKQEEPRRSMYEMIFEKGSSLDVQKAIEAQLESIEARKKQLEHQNIEFVESQKQFEVDKTMMQDKLDKAIIQEYHLKHKLLETTNLQRKLDDREQRLHQKEMIVMKLESRSRKFAEKEAKLKGATLALQQREDLFYDKHATVGG